MAIGSRSQSARTYLEKHLDVFPNTSTDELIAHGLRALRDTLPNEVELTTKVSKRGTMVVEKAFYMPEELSAKKEKMDSRLFFTSPLHFFKWVALYPMFLPGFSRLSGVDRFLSAIIHDTMLERKKFIAIFIVIQEF